MGTRIEATLARFRKCQNLDIQISHRDAVLDAHVICSPDAFTRVVENLLDNANKAQATRIFIGLQETDCSVELTFRDNGVGMSEHQIAELGFRHGTSGQAGRSGRGFAFARRLVADAGGVLERPRSIPGFATEIKVVLKKYVDQHPVDVRVLHQEDDESFVFDLA
jgi:signal transduction histidine kinase